MTLHTATERHLRHIPARAVILSKVVLCSVKATCTFLRVYIRLFCKNPIQYGAMDPSPKLYRAARF